MKKIILLLLAVVVAVLPLCACSGTEDSSSVTSPVFDYAEDYDFMVEVVAGVDFIIYMDKENLGLLTAPVSENSAKLLEKLYYGDRTLSEILCDVAYFGMTDGFLKNGDDFTIILKDVKDGDAIEDIIYDGAGDLDAFCVSSDVGYELNISVVLPE